MTTILLLAVLFGSVVAIILMVYLIDRVKRLESLSIQANNTSADVQDLVDAVGYKPATTVEHGVRAFVGEHLAGFKCPEALYLTDERSATAAVAAATATPTCRWTKR